MEYFYLILKKINFRIFKLNKLGASSNQFIYLKKTSIDKLVSLLNNFIELSRNSNFNFVAKKGDDPDDFLIYMNFWKQIHTLKSNNNPSFEKDGYIFKIKIKE